jgi:hydroxylamine oxidation protein HaoB
MKKQTRTVSLIGLSLALLVSGSALLYKELSTSKESANQDALSFIQTPETGVDLKGKFPADAVNRFTFKEDGKDAFNLLVAQYKDQGGAAQSAVLFPEEKSASEVVTTQTGVRQKIWQTASEVIARHAEDDALIVSWWDDGQRVHFLSGKDAWIRKPGKETFKSPVWKAVKDNLVEANRDEQQRLTKMAGWLTMDSQKALAEMADYFGKKRPVYIVVSNDLLLRQAEFADYGGTRIPLSVKNFPVGDNLHGDIAQVKRWSQDEGEGNYLAQKENRFYRVWTVKKESGAENSLLVRLLPFVDSLKKLPDGVNLIYQTTWGGFLSVYQLDQDAIKSSNAPLR